MKREDLISECKRRSADGADMESIIRFLRISGCSKIETIAVLLKTFDIDPAAAKKVVHFSPTWDDTRASDEKFHEMLWTPQEAWTVRADFAGLVCSVVIPRCR